MVISGSFWKSDRCKMVNSLVSHVRSRHANRCANQIMNQGFRISDSDIVLPKAVLRNWSEQLGRATLVPVRPGMSGARLYRCVGSNGGCLALKRWPSDTGPNRIAEVHRVMTSARSNGCQLIPQVIAPRADQYYASFVSCDGYCWDLVHWMPGQPLNACADLAEIVSGATAISQFHRSAAALGRYSQVAPAIKERLSRLAELHQRMDALTQAATQIELESELKVAVHRAGQLFELKWNEIFAQMNQSLLVYAQQSVMTQFVMRDVHREHVLFSNGQPAGLIDFDALRVDSPAVDLARWVGRFDAYRRDPAGVWQAVLAGLNRQGSSSEGCWSKRDMTLAAAIAGVNPWISLANWLEWLLIDQRSFAGGLGAVSKRISELTDAAAQGVWVK